MSPDWLPLVGLLAICPASSQAHDIYSNLVDNLGASCCSDHDCRPVPYRISAGRVQMHINGGWEEIPSGKIQYRSLPGDTSDFGGGHWCGSEVTEMGHLFYLTRCAILPPESAALHDGIP